MNIEQLNSTARAALAKGDRVRFLIQREGLALNELRARQNPHFVPTGETRFCPFAKREVEVKTNANIPLRNAAARRCNRLSRIRKRLEGRLVRIVDRCDNFFEVREVETGELATGIGANGRLVDFASAWQAAWQAGYSVVAEDGRTYVRSNGEVA